MKKYFLSTKTMSYHVFNQQVVNVSHDDDMSEDVLLADPETEQALKKPSLYAVVMYNDDYTPMDFVVAVLQQHFRHSLDSATNIMLDIHYNGKGIAGVFPKDIAEMKAEAVNLHARKEGYPLFTDIEQQD